jgi:hypothetical protein
MEDLLDEKIRVLVLTAELSSKFFPHIPDYVDFVINESLPSSAGLLVRRIRKEVDKTKTTYSKGVVINMLLPNVKNRPDLVQL